MSKTVVEQIELLIVIAMKAGNASSRLSNVTEIINQIYDYYHM